MVDRIRQCCTRPDRLSGTGQGLHQSQAGQQPDHTTSRPPVSEEGGVTRRRGCSHWGRSRSPAPGRCRPWPLSRHSILAAASPRWSSSPLSCGTISPQNAAPWEECPKPQGVIIACDSAHCPLLTTRSLSSRWDGLEKSPKMGSSSKAEQKGGPITFPRERWS